MIIRTTHLILKYSHFVVLTISIELVHFPNRVWGVSVLSLLIYHYKFKIVLLQSFSKWTYFQRFYDRLFNISSLSRLNRWKQRIIVDLVFHKLNRQYHLFTSCKQFELAIVSSISESCIDEHTVDQLDNFLTCVLYYFNCLSRYIT
jgi:hypothetical protein